ncbi:MerR family transcriptional regulator [Companilactobacillus crustorum]|uniref:MerR family transcriptional regulator n=3 Tax=Companilactobacillus TaxID=2767879 RepID=A0A837RG88_9LACO|nr:MerR family transcriptional regulator [Companilactobacillus crustorum]HCD07322.1 MerR family transcriptional regulator [Lactobacillus sp.]APU71100.1 hypothetical protein BI355_0778 [Companilactobacillus crustorum]KRK41938.1 MerR family transcriptional regulator [Companilactobacillus crustorum JCM 15951]KRO19933.1 MerR family transcriptional regulator [Companilactobacillus crustorum]WDT64657.1 MerR family transcriptional regulator [Companilactobacillus crustorum]
MNKTYSIKEVAEKFALPISTIRYYDKKGLLPFVSKNKAGYRVFSDSDLQFIQTICCLKDTGMSIKKIQKYIELCMQGSTTIDDRKTLLLQHRQNVIQKQKAIEKSLKEIDQKINRYASPISRDLIAAQITYVQNEKASLNLKDPFS